MLVLVLSVVVWFLFAGALEPVQVGFPIVLKPTRFFSPSLPNCPPSLLFQTFRASGFSYPVGVLFSFSFLPLPL